MTEVELKHESCTDNAYTGMLSEAEQKVVKEASTSNINSLKSVND